MMTAGDDLQLFHPPLMITAGDDWQLGTSPLVELESELLRKKHLARFSPEEVCLLLEEMGFDRLDLRGFRVERVDGESSMH